MNIVGLGESLISQLVNNDFIKNPSCLYQLKNKREALLELDRMAEKSIDKLLKEIEKSKSSSFWRLLFALGIPHVGSRAAQIIAEKMQNIDAVINADHQALTEIPEIGPIIATSIVNYFHDPIKNVTINRLRRVGVKLSQESHKPTGILAGQTFVLTGALDNFTRDQASEQIKALGGNTSSNISNKTNYLIAGSLSGSKKAKILVF